MTPCLTAHPSQIQVVRIMNRSRFRMLVPLGAVVMAVSVLGDEWPQWLGPNRDAVWRETGIIQKFPEGGPKIRWRTPIGAGYSGPAVVGDRVYVMDRLLSAGVKKPSDPFDKSALPGTERILCL